MYRPRHVAIAVFVFSIIGFSIFKSLHKQDSMGNITMCLYSSEILNQTSDDSTSKSPDVLSKVFSDDAISTCTSIYTGKREVVKFGDDIKIDGYPNLVHQVDAKRLYQILLQRPGVKLPQSFDTWWNNIPLTIKH
jgi:hypothetical protein